MERIARGDWVRFIPAGAGNTMSKADNVLIATVYPRWRGEHQRGRDINRGWHGLSPLARGTLKQTTAKLSREWFIPAGAGNTGEQGNEKSLNPVYPRWRGEHGLPP